MPACGWEILECQDCTALTEQEQAIQDEIEAWAVNRLWEWTKQRFGPCEVSYRPCRESCLGSLIGGPVLIAGNFTNLVCGSCLHDCSCKSVSEVILPGPIHEVVEVLIDGVPLPLSAVRVDNWNRLVRIDGGRFPICQDLSKEPDEEGTWQVTYTVGEPVPPGGGMVAGILACEYAKYLCNDNSCQLPKRVTSITRQGITMAMIDNFQGLNEGFTGIWVIDDWIAQQNKVQRHSIVSSPDIPKPRRTTWTYASS